jgi:hypothetical protein
MNTSAIVTMLFLVGISILTIDYFAINSENLQQNFVVILSIFSVVNILLLAGLALDVVKNKYWLVIAFIMILEGLAKASFETTIPGKQVDDFIFAVWIFNDQWPYWLKALWHISIDCLVLFVTLILKNSYRIFSKEH